MGFRKEFRDFKGRAAVAGSTDEAFARYLSNRFPSLASKLGRFAPALKWAGSKGVPILGVGLGLYQLFAPGSSVEQRVIGGVTAAASGVLTAAAFGALATGAAAALPMVAAGVLAGVALYQVGKLAYKHWDEIKSGVSKAAKWTSDKLGDAKDWAADKVSDAAGAVRKGVGAAADAVTGAAHTVQKGLGTVANAFGF